MQKESTNTLDGLISRIISLFANRRGGGWGLGVGGALTWDFMVMCVVLFCFQIVQKSYERSQNVCSEVY